MSARKPIKKAVFPVAGLGTRFLPATKAIPKELLPIVDRPLIQYAVDEAREAGIEQMIFVTGRGKSAIVEHFDVAYELESTMAERGKDLSILDPTRATPGDIITVRQQVPLGLGHAIWCARAFVGDEMTRRRGNPHTTWTRRRRNTVDSGAYVRFPFIFSPTSVVYVRNEKR